jgi:Putative esterase
MRGKSGKYPILIACLLTYLMCAAGTADAQSCQVSYSAQASPGPITGRMILALARKREPEPRLSLSVGGPAIFGVDVEALRPGEAATIDARSVGYPMHYIRDLPPGEYFGPALLNVYTEVHRADGHTIWVHLNNGRREFIGSASGNLYSDVQRIHIGGESHCRIVLTHLIPTPPWPKDDQWVKHVRIQSRLLTQFWGHPIFINVTVLLPKGYEDHPNVYYPTIFTMTHHPAPFMFTTDPRSQARWDQAARNETGLESGYEFYRAWVADHFPRVIAIAFEQQTPFFADSYSVNSANNGPYGDALIEEVIPDLEKRFRMISMPYARILEGASTGGWAALGLQLHYPGFFGGAWVLQPDPIDFHRYQLVDIYQDENAFSLAIGQFTSAERPFQRSTEGQVNHTVREESLLEAALGSHGRSEEQFEAWEALYGPVGSDGYPVPLWDKFSGAIDRSVASYMREHGYDLKEYAQRNSSTLGPKVNGKLFFFCGDMDDYYLNLSVYRFQAFLDSTTNPHWKGAFTYGRPMKGHAWHGQTWARMVQDMGEYIENNAPPGENFSLWNY